MTMPWLIDFFCFQAVTAELNMFESHAQQYKNEIEQLTSELHDMKKKYLMQKRKEQACRWECKTKENGIEGINQLLFLFNVCSWS